MLNTCFKAYDIRGKFPEELSPELAYNIGLAVAKFLQVKNIIIGRDVRESGTVLTEALTRGLRSQGVDIIDIGVCGTEEVYFATCQHKTCAGLMITGSHNPIEYNGIKIVGKDAKPISWDTGIQEIQQLSKSPNFAPASHPGKIAYNYDKNKYVAYLLSLIAKNKLNNFTIVTNAGHGPAGLVLDLLEIQLPCKFIKLNNTPDSTFPTGIPNPLLADRRQATTDAVKKYKADLGVAWDGDFDRCFFYDATGRFIEGYYMVGLLADFFLQREHSGKIIYDPRVVFNTIAKVNAKGGIALANKSGHTFFKQRMREENAIYGGEMSAHHYFRDFFYCDSGMLPLLYLLELMSSLGKSLKELLDESINNYPCSGEINFQVDQPEAIIAKVKTYYLPIKPSIDTTDGLSMNFANWRFNLRSSNTEPLIRLNVETKNNQNLLQKKVQELSNLIAT